jgi:hypothetical protein
MQKYVQYIFNQIALSIFEVQAEWNFAHLQNMQNESAHIYPCRRMKLAYVQNM